jgi:arsenical pump membrane protein
MLTRARRDASLTATQTRLAQAPRSWRIGAMDWVTLGLLVTGVLAVAAGLVPTTGAMATLGRVVPLLVFLGSVIVLAELAARAEFFDVVATRVTALGRGRNVALFALILAVAALTTAFLNLDTTAVLLTPVVIATAHRAGLPALPLAMTTVWLANTASLLLPVSNLTNLLAADRIGLSPLAFAARMALPQVAAVAAVGLCLWLFYWRYVPPRYEIPPPHRPRDRRLYWVAAGSVTTFVGGLFAGVPVALVSVVTAAVLLGAFLIWGRSMLQWSLVPWRLLAFVTGLFLVVEAVLNWGLDSVLAMVIGADAGPEGVVRAAVVGAGLANLLNNLPSYVAGEAVIPADHSEQLIGLLIGTNIGPLVVPWASLATLLWAQRCRAAGLRIDWRRYVVTSLVAALITLAASVGAFLLAS